MDQVIDLNNYVYQIVKDHPEVLDLLVELGFKPLKNPAMLNTVGRTTNLKQGAKLIGIDPTDIIQQLKWNGYDIKHEH